MAIKTVKFAVFRHGPTAWNKERRYQGRQDIPLLPESKNAYRQLRIPHDFLDFAVWSSPLSRCLETAKAMGLIISHQEPGLVEMDMGDWEGKDISQSESLHPVTPEGWNGLDFKPYGGESYRDLIERLGPVLRFLLQTEKDTIAVTHRGVISALYAMATGWDMLSKPKHKIDFAKIQLFEVSSDGKIKLVENNISFQHLH